MLLPELRAGMYACLIQKNITIFIPGLGFFSRPGNRFENTVFNFNLSKRRSQFGRIKLMLLDHFINKDIQTGQIRFGPRNMTGKTQYS